MALITDPRTAHQGIKSAMLRRYGATPQVAPTGSGRVDERLTIHGEDDLVDPLKGPIVAPQRGSIAQSVGDIKAAGLIPQYREVSSNSISGLNDVLGNDYFNTLEQQSIKKLRDQYFGGDESLEKQQQLNMNKRGLIGSGIEQGSRRRLFDDFGGQVGDIQADLFTRRLDAKKDLAFKNKEIELANEQRRMDAALKNREFEGFLSELGLRAGADELKSQTDFDTKMFDSALDYRSEHDKNQTDFFESLRQAIGMETIDPETRDYFESIFGSQLGDYFGAEPYSEFSARKASEEKKPIDPIEPGGRKVGDIVKGTDGNQYVVGRDGRLIQI